MNAITGLLVLGLLLTVSAISGIVGALIFKSPTTSSRTATLYGFGAFSATLVLLLGVTSWYVTMTKS